MARRHADRKGRAQENSHTFVSGLPAEPARPLPAAHPAVGRDFQQREGQVADVSLSL